MTTLLRRHFAGVGAGELRVAEREFPLRVRADLQRAVERLFGQGSGVVRFAAFSRITSHDGVRLAEYRRKAQRQAVGRKSF